MLMIIKLNCGFRDDNCNVQIVGMSATLPNLPTLGKWLDADLYQTDFRPVPLTETIKIDRKIYDNKFEVLRSLPNQTPFLVSRIPNSLKSQSGFSFFQPDGDHLAYLCLETLLNGHSVLVFCNSKNWCESLASKLARTFFSVGKKPSPQEYDNLMRGEVEAMERAEMRDKIQSQLNGQAIKEVMEQLKRCPAKLDKGLSQAICFGVAYHHAGLTMDERDIIESAFKSGVLRVIVATSTLSSGVNLPARRVIIRTPYQYKTNLLGTLMYRQMIGRAGRKGVDSEGNNVNMLIFTTFFKC